jgi:uncharacterized protein (TIGR00369 family)
VPERTAVATTHPDRPSAPETPLDAGTERRVRAHFAGVPTLHTLGVTLAALGRGFCEMRVPVTAPYLQQHGYLHGGVIGTLADSASGHAALTLAPPDWGVITVEYKLNFLAPAAGAEVRVRARVIRAGRTLTVSQADAYALHEGAETHCASAIVTYLNMPPRA